jgi:hypothetical protein
MGCIHTPQKHPMSAAVRAPADAAPITSNRSPVPFTDVRVHGPPLDVRIPARAPPLIPHA